MRALVLLMFACVMFSAETARSVPRDLADLFTKVDAETDAAKAVALLREHPNKHPLYALRLGHALMQAGEANQAADLYRAALVAEPDLHEAGIGLAQAVAMAGDWKQAIDLMAKHVDRDNATAPALLFYAQAAYHGGDRRLAAILVEQGLLRFPGDPGFRRLDLTLLVETQRYDSAVEAARALLANDPAQTDVWLALAYAEQERSHDAASRAALEGAWLSAPQDRQTRRRLAEAEAAGGQYGQALGHFSALLSDAQNHDRALIETATQVAVEAGDIKQARAWLALVKPEERDRRLSLMAARLALREDDLEAAEKALASLLASGDSDASVLAWAGTIAERKNDLDRAEAFYAQAAAAGGHDARIADLRRIQLIARRGRRDEAIELIDRHIAAHPDDSQALELKQVLSPR